MSYIEMKVGDLQAAMVDALGIIGEYLALVASQLVSVEDRLVGHVQERRLSDNRGGPHAVLVPSGPPTGFGFPPGRLGQAVKPTFAEQVAVLAERLQKTIRRLKEVGHYTIS